MIPIKSKLNTQALQAINRLWQELEFEDSYQGRINKNIVEVTGAKFIRKQLSCFSKDHKKEFTMSLHYFEAATIKTYLRSAAYTRYHHQSLEFVLITTYCNQLHQKTL